MGADAIPNVNVFHGDNAALKAFANPASPAPKEEAEVQSGTLNNGASAVTTIAIPFGSAKEMGSWPIFALENLIIRGLPECSAFERATDAPILDGSAPALQESHESVEANVLQFLNATLGVRVLPQDISVAHRLKASKQDKVRPVIVKFVSRKVRNNVYQARMLLKGTGNNIIIAQHLTKSTSELFYEARKLLKDDKI